MTSTKPYLIRAIFDWANDNSFTPQVLVNAHAEGVEVPLDHVVDGQIVLNISMDAIQLHVMDNDCLSFSARFSGMEQDIFLPIESILAIFARENSRGIFFEDADDDGTSPDRSIQKPIESVKEKKETPKNIKSRDTSHLKIIK